MVDIQAGCIDTQHQDGQLGGMVTFNPTVHIQKDDCILSVLSGSDPVGLRVIRILEYGHQCAGRDAVHVEMPFSPIRADRAAVADFDLAAAIGLATESEFALAS